MITQGPVLQSITKFKQKHISGCENIILRERTRKIYSRIQRPFKMDFRGIGIFVIQPIFDFVNSFSEGLML